MVPTRAHLKDPNCPVTDSDYDAIVAAIMETSRGRWFLSEYARRNRQADTEMLVGAIDRMKDTLDLYGRASRPYLVNATISSAANPSQRQNTPPATAEGTDSFDFRTLKNCA